MPGGALQSQDKDHQRTCGSGHQPHQKTADGLSSASQGGRSERARRARPLLGGTNDPHSTPTFLVFHCLLTRLPSTFGDYFRAARGSTALVESCCLWLSMHTFPRLVWTLSRVQKAMSLRYPAAPCRCGYREMQAKMIPYAYCSLDKAVACASHIQLPTHM